MDKFNFVETILRATDYVSGYTNNDNKYVLSASMVGREPLQNYLSIIHGKVENKTIDDTTLGSIFHKGMEVIVIESNKDNMFNLSAEMSMSRELENEWIISGTSDLIFETEEGFEIHDYKLSKMYALKQMLKDIPGHQYTKQLQVLSYLFNGDQNTLVVDFFSKDAKKLLGEKTYTRVEVPMFNDEQTLVTELTNMTTSLQSYIESGTIPPQCTDLWPRKVRGAERMVPTKCVLYCSHGEEGLCPYYDPKTRSNIQRITNW